MTTSLELPADPVAAGETGVAAPVAIEVSHLTKVFGAPARRGLGRGRSDTGGGKPPAVADVSFTVAKGEFFVIMGLSGSGKSTLLRMLNKLVEPTSGTLTIDGRDVSRLRDGELRELRNKKINMVFQHFALFPHRTVRDNAAYALRLRGVNQNEAAQRADEALKTVGLEGWGDSLPGELSGGMRQRVGLARALASGADILLMDEPFSALDPLIRRDMQDLLLQLQRDHQRTVVFVTHDLNEAMRLGDRIMVMRNGKVVQLGTGAEILSMPADDYVADFVSDVDRSRVLTAGTIMRQPLVTARLDERPEQVLDRIGAAEGLGAYVLDEDGRILGVLSNDRLADAVHQRSTSLADHLTDQYASVPDSAPLVDLCSLVGRHSVPLAVTDDAGRLVGVVPRAALLAAIANTEEAPRA
ncbi:glycine betaine/proline transport system ATP-binding protein [Quadrisphaera granulorum]|uniref:Glycine betaine/proline transport system ATP-binding protein n=1 Tax=Quadrisphaera granulorum TaxID=317664 RepID=A0A316AG72_9ACTN|nr:betaine/proline/choline family ABC transporter ATP-binding protein [Quadrisphaera granulorum]PWJ48817.1 glycine betaine/proline transport system ATP-binding protein [Quadrisphaera granulorum]SZE98299.1 glycine betaine/proline transport system ATP-binding protein [Quadrisphaera granulorum]